MSGRVVGCLCLFAFLCFCACPLVAQAPAPQTKADFAVEILGESPAPLYATIPVATPQNPCSTFNYQGTLRRLASASANIEQPAGLELEICVREDTFLITPVLFYGKASQFGLLLSKSCGVRLCRHTPGTSTNPSSSRRWKTQGLNRSRSASSQRNRVPLTIR